MFNKSSLYVSIIRYYNQLKFDYKQLVNDDIVKAEQSSFLVHGNSLSQDVVYKLKILEQNEPQTFISTLCDSSEQKLVLKSPLNNSDSNVIVPFNSEYNLALDKSALFETKYFFEASGVDYIYSPFHILNLHCEQNPSASTFNGFIVNNSLYILILNQNNQVVYSGIEALTSFEEIQKSNFYDNEIFGQKLFDEIYYFEIESIINTVLEKFYETKEKLFIDKVTILHMIKQLNEEQINRLHNELLIEVNYHPISVDDYIYELAKQPLKMQRSFIKPRKKEKSKFVLFSLIAFTLMITFGAFYFYNYMNGQKHKVQEEIILEKSKAIEKKEQEKEEALKPKLPNHMLKNHKLQKRVLTLFDIIPYSVVVEELEVGLNSAFLKISLLEDDIYIKDMQPKLLHEYKFSSIEFGENQSKGALKATIDNSEYIEQPQTTQEVLPEYIQNGFLPKQQVEEILGFVLGEKNEFVFKSDFKSDISTFNYEVVMHCEEPQEFFTLIEVLNEQKYSMNVSYPVKMKKSEKGIEVRFILQFHQNE
ncbi:MAG: hypothetical protein WC141_01430 [Arcobacteraceae bacterium]